MNLYPSRPPVGKYLPLGDGFSSQTGYLEDRSNLAWDQEYTGPPWSAIPYLSPKSLLHSLWSNWKVVAPGHYIYSNENRPRYSQILELAPVSTGLNSIAGGLFLPQFLQLCPPACMKLSFLVAPWFSPSSCKGTLHDSLASTSLLFPVRSLV